MKYVVLVAVVLVGMAAMPLTVLHYVTANNLRRIGLTRVRDHARQQLRVVQDARPAPRPAG